MAIYWGPGRFSDDEVKAMDLEKEAEFRRIIAADFPVMPGAVDLIAALRRAGFGVAIGSSAPRENVTAAVDRLGIGDQFAAVVTGGDVRHGKPDPQVFLLGAQGMGLPPARCVVIEDAPVGIAAAAAAGMACVGLASTGRTREVLSAAQLVVDSLSELSPEVLRQVIERQDGRPVPPSAKAARS
jgi:beta-phosphoglucomutase